MLLTVQLVKERLNVSQAHVYRLIERGELSSHRIGKSIRISEEDLEAFLKRAKVHPEVPVSPQRPAQLDNLRLG